MSGPSSKNLASTWKVSLLCLALFSATARAQQDDVTFFVIGKHANYEQLPDGTLQPVDHSFFAEIFFSADGDAASAYLETPAAERIRFRDQRLVDGPEKDNLLLISGAKRFASYEELQSWYPDGEYRIDFETPSGSVHDARLEFPLDGLPQAPRIILRQNGEQVCGTVSPNHDLQVAWSGFSEGRADANGILDDLIFAILEDETGERVSHSGRPFSDTPYLTYADSTYTIAASVLQDGRQYNLGVEHAALNSTGMYGGVPAMTTYAVTTNLTLRVAANNSEGCSAMTNDQSASARPTTDAQIVMFYYADLAEPDRFYGEKLGLEKTLDEDWVKLYRTSANGTVGLVAEGEGAWHDVQDSNAVMLSIVTSEVDAWYDMLKRRDDVRFLKELGDSGPIRNFLIEDPGGYTVEFFGWREGAD